MSDKERLYMEDAINHERIVSRFLEENSCYLENEEVCDFFMKEKKKHDSFREKLFKCLKEKSDEWYRFTRRVFTYD